MNAAMTEAAAICMDHDALALLNAARDVLLDTMQASGPPETMRQRAVTLDGETAGVLLLFVNALAGAMLGREIVVRMPAPAEAHP